MNVLMYKSLIVVIPSEPLNENVNPTLTLANNKDYIVQLESMVNFYHRLSLMTKKTGRQKSK